MTLQEILKAKGMTDENIEATLGEMKQNKIFTTQHENMDVRYPKLQTAHDTLNTQHGEATKLIEQLKSGTKDNEALQGKVATYEKTISDLQAQLKQTQLDAAIKVALAGAKATDADYMAYRMKEKEKLELDDQGNIKGIDDILSGLKTQYPAFFESGAAGGGREIEPHKLPPREAGKDGVTKAEFLRKPYSERAAFAAENPEAYNAVMNQ